MKSTNLLKIAISMALLALILYFVDLGRLVMVIYSADLLFIGLAFLVTPATMLLRFIRWKKIISLSGSHISIAQSARIYLLGFFFGTLTPSKIGDLLKFRYLHRYHSVPKGTSLSLSFLDRIFDLMVVIAISVMSLTLVYRSGAVISVMVAATAFLIMVYSLFSRKISSKLFYLFIPRALSIGKIIGMKHRIDSSTFESIYLPFGKLKSSPFEFIWLSSLSIAVWFSVGLQLMLLFLAFNAPVNFLPLMAFFSLSTLIGLIPVTISGLGTREATMIFLFSLLGLSAETTLSVSLTELVIGQLVVTLAGGLLYVFLKTSSKSLT